MEYQRALVRWNERRDIRVIPVLLGDTVMPASEDLPSELGDLWRLHAFRLSHESWGSDIQRLLTQLRAVAEGQLERRKTAEPERAAREREALERAERERAEQQAAEEEQAAREAEVRRPREVETQKRREAEVAVPRGAKAVSPRRQHARWRTPTAVAVVLAVGAVGVGAALLVARGRRD